MYKRQIPAKYTESKQDELVIAFDGSEVTYPRNEWLKLTLAYAMSIHKSQGSEFQVVILPITRQSGRLLQRNLIYTAITRSKSKLIMLGELAAFDYAIHNEGIKRQTYLVERFQEQEPEEKTQTNQTQADLEKPANHLNGQVISRSKAHSTKASLTKQQQPLCVLTPDNFLTIDPMIGITEDDICHFFQKNP
mgnify:FL=1